MAAPHMAAPHMATPHSPKNKAIVQLRCKLNYAFFDNLFFIKCIYLQIIYNSMAIKWDDVNFLKDSL